jgi:hypothetical protein
MGEIEFREFEVAGLGDFEIARGAGDDGDGNSGAFSEGGFVGALEAIGFGIGEGATEETDAEGLGSLGEDDAFAGDGGGDDGTVRGALDDLDGVQCGGADDGGSVLGDGIEDAMDGGGVNEWANGVVDEDDVVVLGIAEGGQSVADGVLPGVSARNDEDGYGEGGMGG